MPQRPGSFGLARRAQTIPSYATCEHIWFSHETAWLNTRYYCCIRLIPEIHSPDYVDRVFKFKILLVREDLENSAFQGILLAHAFEAFARD